MTQKNYTRARLVRRRVKTPVGAESRTQQSFEQISNINNIMAKYRKTGLIDHVSRYQGSYGDFTDAPDYHTAMNKMFEADAMFRTVPANIRELFENDPGLFLEFVMDPDSEDQMRELGLLPAKRVSPELAPAPEEEETPKPPKE